MLNDSETSHKKVIRLNGNLACEMFRILNMTKCREKPLNLMTLGGWGRLIHLKRNYFYIEFSTSLFNSPSGGRHVVATFKTDTSFQLLSYLSNLPEVTAVYIVAGVVTDGSLEIILPPQF